MDKTWQRIKTEIVGEGLSSFTGLEIGLSKGQLKLKNPPHDLTPIPAVPEDQIHLDPAIWEALPDHGLPYPELTQFVFGKQPESWLTGIIEQGYVGYANHDQTRIQGASGGILTQALIHLLNTKQITGAIVTRLSPDNPCVSETIIARTPAEIQSASGSIYTESSPLTILDSLQNEEGPLAFVGLPDHVAAIRMLQKLKHPSVQSISYVFGPYTGTILTFQGLESYLHSNNTSPADVLHLSYRSGEWPGYLEIQLRDGRTLRAEKFYYNYLIPFFITRRSSRLAVDFTNELTDISVGDAWAPEYEKKKGGYSVVLARTPQGKALLDDMLSAGLITLTPTSQTKVIEMHSHMIDFKKRGTFIRMEWRSLLGKRNPYFGYYPESIPLSRYAIECVISGLFFIGSTRPMRYLVEHIPLHIIGPVFNALRLSWKRISSSKKRDGLAGVVFTVRQ